MFGDLRSNFFHKFWPIGYDMMLAQSNIDLRILKTHNLRINEPTQASKNMIFKKKRTLPETNTDTQKDGLEIVSPFKYGNF